MIEFAVTVRELARFCHRSGDIDYRFSASPTSEEGIEGHQRLFRRRPESYRREFGVEALLPSPGPALRIRGRADGWDAERRLVEEIKTCRVDPARIPQPVTRLHLAQARLYAALIARAEGVDSLTVRLTWYDIDQDREYPVDQHYGAQELEAFLLDTVSRYGVWLAELGRLREARDRSLAGLQFPHPEFRPGQREAAELVYKCIDQGGQLMLEAPTGIGKTMAVLFPALKGLGEGKHEAVLYGTARTVGRRAAEQALERLREAGLAAVSLSLTARDQICFSPGMACRGEECPFALGFYDRLPAAMGEALGAAALTRPVIEEIARRHTVCPYQLGIELAPWVDVIVCDLHYLYSLTAAVAGWTAQTGGRWSVLVDEAHNLPERARGMYGAGLAKAELMQARRGAPPPLRRILDRTNRLLLALLKEPWPEPEYACRESLPPGLVEVLAEFSAAFIDTLVRDPSLPGRAPALLEFHFRSLQFLRTAEVWGDEFRCELSRSDGQQSLRLKLNCLDPGRLLAERQAALHSVTMFSATLSPAAWLRPRLGLGPDTVVRQVASPFRQDQLQVEINRSIDTRYRGRGESLPALAGAIGDWLQRKQGNCLVYFPSYRYLDDCLALLSQDHPALAERELWVQARTQDASQRAQLLERLGARRNLVAFCILGGVFGEGIDLPGDQLASVVVVGVGLPQVDREARQLQAFYDAREGAGFDFAFRFPGMQKVNQALGRVIRGATDRGDALLIDPRYGERGYRELLAPWWCYREAGSPQARASEPGKR